MQLGPVRGGEVHAQDKHKLRLREIISAINDLFDGEITEGDAVAYVDSVIKTKMLESDLLRSQAAANTKEQFTNSPNLSDEPMNAIMDAMAASSVHDHRSVRPTMAPPRCDATGFPVEAAKALHTCRQREWTALRWAFGRRRGD